MTLKFTRDIKEGLRIDEDGHPSIVCIPGKAHCRLYGVPVPMWFGRWLRARVAR